jgi:Tol biopolymer transport system component
MERIESSAYPRFGPVTRLKWNPRDHVTLYAIAAGLVSSAMTATLALALATPGETSGIGYGGRAPALPGLIVFRRYFDDNHQWGALFTVKTNGTQIRQLTHPPKGVVDDEPVWSPDGRRIAFQHSRANKSLIYVAHADGSDEKQLAPCTGWCASQDSPTWSPDGSKIAMGVRPLVGHESVWIVSASGTGPYRLTQRGKPRSANTGMDDSQPAWSPDGKRILFVRHMAQPGPHGRLATFVIGADGRGERQFTPWWLRSGHHPTWSRDGTRVVLTSNADYGTSTVLPNIYSIRTNGTGLTQLTHARAGQEYLSSSFSPDGKWITFGMKGGKDAKAALYVMRANGTGVRYVIKSAFWDSTPDWKASPRR